MKSLERATKWCAFIINETNKNSNYALHKQCLCRISRRKRNIHFQQPNNDVLLFFRQLHVITGQFTIKVCLRAVKRRARRACGRGSLSRQAGCRSPVPATLACAPTEGKGVSAGQPPQAPRDRRGLCQAGFFRAPSAPRDRPGLAQAVLGPAAECLRARGLRDPRVVGLQGTGRRSRTTARRAPAFRTRAARVPACPSPADPPVEFPPASRVPRDPYLALGPGGGGGPGRRPARLPRFRRTQELNIPPLRAAPMRKTSRQQHHLPPSAEPPARQPPGTPGQAPSGEAGAQGHRDPGCCKPGWDWMH